MRAKIVLTNTHLILYALSKINVRINSGSASLMRRCNLWESTRIHQLCLHAPCLPTSGTAGTTLLRNYFLASAKSGMWASSLRTVDSNEQLFDRVFLFSRRERID